MAISLSNAVSGKREPKRANRWILKFESIPYPEASAVSNFSNGATDTAESLAIDLVSAGRPQLSVNANADIARLNEKWKFAQNPTWEPISITFYDFDSGQSSAAQIVWRWMQTIYDVLNGTMGYAATYKVDASLILLGPGQTSATGTGGKAASTEIEIIEAWDLFGCFPNQMTTGELNYGNTDVLQVTIDLQYDYANLHTATDFGTAKGLWSTIS